jgi:hypothetical protein
LNTVNRKETAEKIVKKGGIISRRYQGRVEMRVFPDEGGR